MQLSTPGMVTDLATDQQRSAWSEHLSSEIDDAITGVNACAGIPQYVNPAVVDVSAFQRAPIHWPGFPKLLYSQFADKQGAYAAADAPTTPSGKYIEGGRAVQDEYLEWFIHRDAQGRIRAVDFTTETQEYWTFLFSADKQLAATAYTNILRSNVSVADISTPAGAYNPFNKFNTTDGVVHLLQRNNTLPAELDIAAQATLPRVDSAGNVTTDVVSCTHCGSNEGLGEPGRNSDPTIAQMVNAVAANACLLTIPDPVGLYIQALDMTGWTTPGNVALTDCWTIVRGTPAVRATFTVPEGAQLTDFSIGGIPVTYAGQIAEKISVFLTAAFGPNGAVQLPAPRKCSGMPDVTAAALAVVTKRLTRKAQ
ncbi:hypothetical protein [Paraburkholderia sediminicola]|uniref:hypothetical protein n=1 Tax=Paraburkholderia sediminicola TaxID=458836 RepID=UPI0038BD3DA0